MLHNKHWWCLKLFVFTLQQTCVLRFHICCDSQDQACSICELISTEITQKFRKFTEAFVIYSFPAVQVVSWSLFSHCLLPEAAHGSFSPLLNSGKSLSKCDDRNRAKKLILTLGLQENNPLFIAFCGALNWILLAIKILSSNTCTNAPHVNSICINAVCEQHLYAASALPQQFRKLFSLSPTDGRKTTVHCFICMHMCDSPQAE